MALGPTIRERRTERGFSQDRLAREAGLTWSAVQKLETGKIVDPHYSTLAALAHALDMTVAELMGEQEVSHRVPLAAVGT